MGEDDEIDVIVLGDGENFEVRKVKLGKARVETDTSYRESAELYGDGGESFGKNRANHVSKFAIGAQIQASHKRTSNKGALNVMVQPLPVLIHNSK